MAAFDFDGTLVPGDSLAPFLARLCGPARFTRAGLGSGLGMLAAYRRGGRDASKAVLLERAVAGIPAARAAVVGASYSAGLARRIRPAMTQRIGWHRDRGHRLVLVSASLTAYLVPLAQRLGFDHVIATQLEEGPDGLLTGRLEGPNVRGQEKAERLARFIGGEAVELWAYGDSTGDRELLGMADHPTWVGRR